MEHEKLQIETAFSEPICADIDKAEKLWENEKDILKILRIISDMSNKIRQIPEYKDTPENRFATFIVWSVISHTISIFQGKNKSWLDVNSEYLQDLGDEMIKYSNKLKIAFENNSYQDVLEASKIYLFSLIKIVDKLSLSY